MRLLIIGHEGQLGQALKEHCARHNISALCPPTTDGSTDVRNIDTLRQLFTQPIDAVVNCAAVHDLLLCEQERDLAVAVNVKGTENLIELCSEADTPLVTISTDYVFDGLKHRPYCEKDYCKPLNYYGQTKLWAEILTRAYEKGYVVRISSLWSEWGSLGKGNSNFFLKVLAAAKEHQRNGNHVMYLPNNITMSPTYARDAAAAIINILSLPPDTYHASNSGHTTWLDFAAAIITQANLKLPLKPAKDQPTFPARPNYSALSTEKLARLWPGVRPWQDAIKAHFQNIY